MAFQINGVEVFNNEAALSKVAITSQRDGAATEITNDDQVLLYDGTTEELMKVDVGELFQNLKATNTDVVIGFQAGFGLTDDNENTLVGNAAAPNLIQGVANSVVGFQAGFGFNPPAGAGGLVAMGWRSAAVLTEGNLNSAYGYISAPDTTTGFANVFLGSGSGRGLVSGNSNIFIGNDSGGIAVGSSDFYGSNNIVIGFNHESIFQANSMSVGVNTFSWIRGTLFDFGNGTEPITLLPRTQVDGNLVANQGLTVNGNSLIEGIFESRTSVTAPVVRGNQSVVMTTDLSDIDNIIQTFNEGKNTSTFSIDFTNISNNIAEQVVGILMRDNVSKCIVTAMVQSDTDLSPSVVSSTIFWNGTQAVSSAPFGVNLSPAQLDVVSASAMTFRFLQTTDGFGVAIVQPGATPTSGRAYVTVESYKNPITTDVPFP